MADTISFARGAPSLDIVDQEGLRDAAARAFTGDPAGTFAYGTSVGYVPLREWIAEQHDVTLFEDDPYLSIRFEGESLPTMLSQDEAGKVVYASSFSKTVCPGIRVGYLVGPQAGIKQVQTIATNTYISPNMVAQSIVNQFARSGRMDSAVQTVKTALRERRDAVVAALERELPEAAYARPEGGYFMWVELPEEIRVDELER